MKIDVVAFKKELENYSYYQTNLEGTKRLIEYNEYLLSNVHGLDPSKESGNGSSIWVETDAFKRITDELERLYKRKELREAQIEYIESILNKLSQETREACLKIYVEGESYAKVSSERFLSKKGLFSRVERELNNIL